MGYKMPLFYLDSYRLSKVNEHLRKLYGREMPSIICKSSKKPVTGKKYCEVTQLLRSQFLTVFNPLHYTPRERCSNDLIKEKTIESGTISISQQMPFNGCYVKQIELIPFLRARSKRASSKCLLNCFVTENYIPEVILFSTKKHPTS